MRSASGGRLQRTTCIHGSGSCEMHIGIEVFGGEGAGERWPERSQQERATH
jgi:hypothetical protein